VTVPDLLTVEEAAALLRIGRTKAYAMAKEWRSSDGASGLPVVDLGHRLRVPRAALERWIGAVITGPVADAGCVCVGENERATTGVERAGLRRPGTWRHERNTREHIDAFPISQLGLFQDHSSRP
jgi:excisionase family DNA binding protein